MDAPARLEAMLDRAEEQIARMADARPDDPELLAKVDRIREGIERDAGPYVPHVRERFTCILGSLGLIPADNEGEPCGGDRLPAEVSLSRSAPRPSHELARDAHPLQGVGLPGQHHRLHRPDGGAQPAAAGLLRLSPFAPLGSEAGAGCRVAVVLDELHGE